MEQPDLRERSLSIYTMHRAHFESRLFDDAYWERYFGMLARCRFNSFVVVFGYENGGFMAPPYPYFFDVEGFPDVRLVGITAAEQANHVRALKRLIACAHRHGIDFTPAIWDHIYRGGVQSGGIRSAREVHQQPTPGLVWGVTTGNLAAYNRAAIARFLDVFPEIDGIQFRMHGESGLRRDEIPRFWHEVFQTIRQKRPDLRVDIRAKGLPDAVIEDGLQQGLQLRVTTKYWMEQMGLPFHPTHVNPPNQRDRRHGYADLLTYPQRYKVHWRMWNGGTTRVLLWGSPDYTRRFVQSTHLYDGESFEVNEPLATKMLARPHDEEPRDILNPPHRYYDWEFERYWHFFQVFGRLGYNPDTPADVWEQEFQRRFGGEAGVALMQGLHAASQVLPRIVAASYPYRYFPTTRGWPEKMRMGDLPEFAKAEGSDVQQFAGFAEAAQLIRDGQTTTKRLPAETSRWFAGVSQSILGHVAEAEAKVGSDPSKEFQSTVVDLKILAYLALYHSHRMPAAVSYNLYRQTGDLWSLDDAIAAEQRATDAWQMLVHSAGDVYADYLPMGIQHGGLAGHWRDELALLREGIEQLQRQRAELALTAPTDQLTIAHVAPRRVAPAETVTLRASVFASSGPARVRCIVHAAQPHEYPMQPAGQWKYQARVPLPPEGEKITYYLQATDAQDQRCVYPADAPAEMLELHVFSDRQPPQVALSGVGPVRTGQLVRVTARVSDPSGVESVRLRYRHLTQFEDYRGAEMNLDVASGLYVGEIPAEFTVPRWDVMFFVEAIDRAGNGRNYPDLETEMPYVIVPLQREGVTQ